MTHVAAPDCGWKARGDRKPHDKRRPFNRPSLRQTIECLPYAFRYLKYWCKHYKERDKLFINAVQPLRHNPHYGVPCGGIGCGSIGTDYRGGFCKFSLRPGVVENDVKHVLGDNFILTVRQHGQTIYQKVLCASRRRRLCGALNAWDFSFPANRINYTGLYPRAWTEYEIPECGLRLTRRQISPVIPHDYKDSSLPVCVFVWTVEHLGTTVSDALHVCLTFTWRAGSGDSKFNLPSNDGQQASTSTSSTLFDSTACQGVLLTHSTHAQPCTYGLGVTTRVGQQLTRCVQFDASGSGAALWEDLSQNGVVSLVYDSSNAQRTQTHLGVGVSVSMQLQPGQKQLVEMALCWDMPVVQFGTAKRLYKRRYTRFFSDESSQAEQLCAYALSTYTVWEQRINEWQRPILVHPSLPQWYKSALFNELYFVSDGGSIWVEYDAAWHDTEPQLSEYSARVFRRYGRFAYLESWEYRMFNTYDVHFYASFALASLWPCLEHSIQADFCDQILYANKEPAAFHFDGSIAPVKAANRVPHDLGNPYGDPWLHTNSYRTHDTAQWRDLNLKFVLATYRDYVHVVTDDFGEAFLQRCWPCLQAIMHDALEQWDLDGDGMIENSGTCDQTYDAWKMDGVSAYCGGLWLAAVACYAHMALLLGDKDEAALFDGLLKSAQHSYQNRLWTGSYYAFDERSRSKSTCMADQLCGFWYLSGTDGQMAADLLPPEHVQSCLNSIFRLNVMSFAGGKLGAVNGMRPNGRVDRAGGLQAEEMWTGTSYALAALFMHKGMVRQAWHTSRGVYDSCSNAAGLQYQTPESMFARRYYRAVGYMRPLAIWAIQWTLVKQHNFPHLPAGVFPSLPAGSSGGMDSNSVTSNLSALAE